MMATDKSYLGLEGLRFLCAVAVLFWHYQHFYMLPVVDGPGGFVPGFAPGLQPFHAVFPFLYSYGYLAVNVFWEISGFIFFWKYHAAIRDGVVSGWRFFVLRLSRLYPLHVTTLVAVAALQIAYAARHGGATFVTGNNDAYHFLLNLGFASGWGFERGLSFNNPIWSVSAEIVVYALFFVVSCIVRAELVARIGLVGLTAAVWVANEKLGGPQGLRVLLTCAVYFFAGGVVHALVRLVPGGLLKWLSPLCLVAAVGLVFALFKGEQATAKPVIAVFTTLVLAGFLGLDQWTGLRPALARLAPLADMTYSSYLVHFPLQIAFALVTDGLGLDRHVYDGPVPFLAFVAITFALAWVVFHRFERPAQAWMRRHMLGGRPAGRAEPAGA